MNEDNKHINAEQPDQKATSAPHPSDAASAKDSEETNAPGSARKERKRLSGWVRIPLKVLMWIIIVILLIPVLIYIPPIQTLLKDAACSIVNRTTGMNVRIDRFSLRFPLDVELSGVRVLDAHRDTMVMADKAIADVKLMPLLHLDVKLNKLVLENGYYRMVSPDSSMILAVKARDLMIDGGSAVNIATSVIDLNKVKLAGGKLDLYMNVWKQKPTPPDSTASTPFLINARQIDIEDFEFGMSMLPTIDTLRLNTRRIALRDGVIDLRTNKISAKRMDVADGSFTYLTPTAEYIAAHPAPPPLPSSGPPMQIAADSITLTGFKALYATKGAKPAPGFDPTYMQFDGVKISMENFFNESSSVRLPISRLEARERSGLQVIRGSGTIAIDSLAIGIQNLDIATLYSQLHADADISFAMMAMQPAGPVKAALNGEIGIPDLTAFMPSLRAYTSVLPTQRPISVDLAASGSLSSINIPTLRLSIPSCLTLAASGEVNNALDPKRLSGDLDFDGTLSAPAVINKLAGPLPVTIPKLALKGSAAIAPDKYAADFTLRTPEGNMAADGKLNLRAESYDLDLNVNGLNIAQFMPELGVGAVSAHLSATGAGFNPARRSMHTKVDAEIAHVEYMGHAYRDITLNASLLDGVYSLYLDSPNPNLDLTVEGSGSIEGDTYNVDLRGKLNNVDLQALGLSETPLNGHGELALVGSAAPDKWLYDLDLDLADIDFTIGENRILIPFGASMTLQAGLSSVAARINAPQTTMAFDAESGLKQLIDSFSKAASIAMTQIDEKRIDVEKLRTELPPFDLNLNASGSGLISQFLEPSQLSLDTVWMDLHNHEGIYGNAGTLSLNTGSLRLDTLTLTLKERNEMLDYRLHLGNRKGNLDEFASVNVMGYLGGNRASISAMQKNAKGETGYRLGLTAALQDSTVSVHFTPSKATIAYMPWTVNDDNYIDYSFNGKIDANLTAKSAESSISVQTVPRTNGEGNAVKLNLANIKIEDFLQLSVFAPPITGSINSDMTLFYNGKALGGSGTLGLENFAYDRQRIGSFDFEFKAGTNMADKTGASASLLYEGRKVLTARGYMLPDTVNAGKSRNKFTLTLDKFPLKIANPFLGADIAQLSGGLNGSLEMTGEFSEPVLNGSLACDSVGVRIPMMGTTLRMNEDPIVMNNNVLTLNQFKIYGANQNPLMINGVVNAEKFSDIGLDIKMDANNFQLVGNDRRAKSDIYGKLFLNLAASAKGSLNLLDINANASVLPATDIYYTLPSATSAITEQDASGVVKFVNFADSLSVAKADSIQSAMSMKINAQLAMQQGAQVTVNLSNNGTDKVQLTPYGNLVYTQNYLGDMRLNGQLFLGDGFARYSVPVVGEKMFTFSPGSYVLWNGDLMNPLLHIDATDTMKASVKQDSQNSRLINFIVSLSVGNTLSAPSVQFDLTTDDDISIRNELQSMSADQRSNQAMNLLLYGVYTGPGTKGNTNLSGNPLYSYLESTINSWAAKNIRGVDLSFGIDQYNQTIDGQKSSSMTYSYQLSKSLFNNRFKIVVGGNYSTDADADENLEQNLISDISFEYIFKQTNTLTLYGRIFRHTGFESILEGEVTQTGLGFVMKRRLSNLKSLFRFKSRKRKTTEPDSTRIKATTDTVITNRETTSK